VSSLHTERTSQRELRIRDIALNGRKMLAEAYKDPHFCVGSAWASLSLILGELGEAYERPPWAAPLPDEEKSHE
jgi:hypothetical protein